MKKIKCGRERCRMHSLKRREPGDDERDRKIKMALPTLEDHEGCP